jgi:capsular exopolysaccharide synthesis family protein
MPKKKSNKVSLITQLEPDSQLAESYRTIRTTIKYSALDKGKQIFLITSPLAGEGKTSVAINLAILTAQDGKRVLLIDGDLRRPNLHFILNCPNRYGLSTILSGFADPAHTFASTGVENLDLLPAGPIQSRPAELLGSSKMDQLIKQCIGHYDVIIIDSPPLLSVTDATLLARVSESIVIVTRAGLTKREHVKRAQSVLEPFRDRVVGIVFNGMT